MVGILWKIILIDMILAAVNLKVNFIIKACIII